MTGDSLTQFLSALRAVTLRGERLDFSAADVADAIWLAPYLDEPGAGVDDSDTEAPAKLALASFPKPPEGDEPGGCSR